MQDYQNFAKAQLDVYGLATFGWAYWAYKCQYEQWSLKWMIENNYIKLQIPTMPTSFPVFSFTAKNLNNARPQQGHTALYAKGCSKFNVILITQKKN